jgi:CzcA family heavy metal efflux pump
MMRWIIGSSLALRFLVLVMAASLVVLGVTQLPLMPVDVLPEFDPPFVEVQTEALGLSAVEMEALITVTTEADLLNGVAWLDQIYSESVAGLSSILLIFEPGTDPIRARQMVQERLTQAFALPNVSKPPTMLQPLSTTSRVMMVGLSSDELSLIDIGVLARWVIKPRLLGVPGVANVAIWGQREWQLQVQVHPEQLRDTGVSLQQVIETTGEALWVSPLPYLESSTPGTAGWIDTPNQRLSLRHELPIKSAEDLVQIPVTGTAWRLGDVAQVVEDHQPLIGDAILTEGPGILLVIEKFPEAHTLEVTRGLEEALEAMQPGLTGIKMDTTIFRPADYIEQATSNLSTSLLIGAVLAILVIGAFTFDWRPALISLAVIAVSLMAALLVLYLSGTTLNLMTLAGLGVALGVIVDDAIIGVENVMRRLRQRREEESRTAVISESLMEIRSPLGFATLIILLTAIPFFSLEGMTGAFFEPLVVSYLVAVLSSLAAALIIAPAMSAILLSGDSIRKDESPVVLWLQRIYNKLLARSIRAAYPALAVVGALMLVGLVMVPFLESSSMPALRQTDLRIQWEGAPGTSRPEMSRIMARASDELRTVPGVLRVASHLGRAITGDQVVGINSGEIWINLDPAADYGETVAGVREVTSGYPGLFRHIEPYLPERLGEALGGPDQDIVVRVYGHEFDVLRSKAEEVRLAISTIKGLGDLAIEPIPEEPLIEIEPDLAEAERYQVKPGDIRRAATTLLSGLQVGNLYEEQKVFDVVVWGVPEIRNSLTDIQQLLIDTPRGGHVLLREVADVRIAPTPIIIRRDAVSRYIDIGGNVSGRSLASVLADVESAVQEISFPFEYHAEVISESLEWQTTQRRVLSVAAVALVGIFLLLQAVFDSWRLAGIGTLTILAALVGGVLAAMMAGGVISIGSIFGFLAVIGITVRNSVVMIRHFQHLEWNEGDEFGAELVMRGARERMAPVLMTTLVVGLALLPLVIMGDVAGSEILRPMSIVVLGGLIAGTLLNLFILPPLYLRYGFIRPGDRSSRSLSNQPGLSTSSE